jgi:hypothetical protein
MRALILLASLGFSVSAWSDERPFVIEATPSAPPGIGSGTSTS